MDLSTTYMGMKLRTPLVVSASSLSEDMNNIKKMEQAGASAVVMYSLFEEQIRQEQKQLDQYMNYGTHSFAEALTYLPEPAMFKTSGKQYLELLNKAKKSLSIPVIASLNGVSPGGWTKFARQMQEQGVDALELNIYFLPTDMNVTGAQVEQTYIDILESVKSAVNIPVAVKLSPFFSNTANMAKRLEQAGANALVLFNRFYQPDVYLEELEIRPRLLLSTAQELRLPLAWIGILYGRVKMDLAATTGIHTAEDMLKMLMVGAKIGMLCSTLFKNGIDHIKKIEQEMTMWLTEHDYKSVQQMCGSMSQIKCSNPDAFERAQYMRALKTCTPTI